MDHTGPKPEHDTLLYIFSDMVFAGARSGMPSEALAWYFLRRLAAQLPAIADAFPLGALAQTRAIVDGAPARMPPELSVALADGIYDLAHRPTPETETQVGWRVLAQLSVCYPEIGATLTPAGRHELGRHLLAQPMEGAG